VCAFQIVQNCGLRGVFIGTPPPGISASYCGGRIEKGTRKVEHFERKNKRKDKFNELKMYNKCKRG
jgi:hypothetical protein